MAQYQIVGGRLQIVGGQSTRQDLANLLAMSGAVVDVPNASPLMQEAVMSRVSESGVLVREQPFTKGSRVPLGFDSGATLIAAAGTQIINAQPQIPFRVERLVVPSDIGGSFAIRDVVVGKDSQFASTRTSVPARVFDEQAVGVSLMGDTAQISQDVSISVENISGAPARFRAAIIGSAVS